MSTELKNVSRRAVDRNFDLSNRRVASLSAVSARHWQELDRAEEEYINRYQSAKEDKDLGQYIDNL